VRSDRFERDAVTRAAYLMLGIWGFLLYAFGPALPALREQLDVSRAAVSLHTTLTATGAIIVGLFGDRIVSALGRRRGFWAAAAGISLGAVVLAGGGHLAITLSGALVFGFAGALQVALVQSTLADHHGALAAAAILESNALATALGAAAPFIVAVAILAGGDWRAVFLGAALLAIPAVAFVYRSVTFPLAPVLQREAPRALPRKYWFHWTALLFFIAVEFCIAFWATDFLETERGFGDSAAAASASLLLVGMTIGRVLGGWLAKRMPAEPILFAALAVGAAGFVVFWLIDAGPAALAGLALAGLGIALLYPLTLALAIAASGGRTDAASARAAFAAGIAIAVAPFVLGALADESSLVVAYGVVPVLFAAGSLTLLLARRVREQPTPAR
jgi:fucose permease